MEHALWSALRNRKLGGFKFRRQWTIAPYVADFACLEAKLIVELDGGQHSPERDDPRTRYLEQAGFSVMRFWNNEVVKNRQGVLETILAALVGTGSEGRKTLTQPSSAKAGEG